MLHRADFASKISPLFYFQEHNLIRTRDFLTILLLAFFWSFTFLIIRVSVDTIQPLTLTFYRLLYGFGFLIFASLASKTNPFRYWRHWGKLIFSGFLLNALPFTLCALGEQTIDSSTAGIIEGTVPFFVLFVAWAIFREKTISFRQIRAIVLAFLGLLVIFFPYLSATSSEHEILGMSYLFSMSLVFAIGFKYSEHYLKEIPPVAAVTTQFIFAPLMMIPPVLYENNGVIPTIPLHIHGFLAVLGVVSTMGWLTYFYAIRRTNANNVSIATMICPIMTIFWGWLFLSEGLSWNKILGTLIVLSALSILWNFHGRVAHHVRQRRKKT